ncbi:hypothetical protein U1Q18_031946 [Sarracenia purpurea var. burkii]
MEKGATAAAAGGGGSKDSEKESLLICRRCKQSYKPSINNPSSCRFHPSFFVCRRHDDQKSSGLKVCRIEGKDLGYTNG